MLITRFKECAVTCARTPACVKQVCMCITAHVVFFFFFLSKMRNLSKALLPDYTKRLIHKDQSDYAKLIWTVQG